MPAHTQSVIPRPGRDEPAAALVLAGPRDPPADATEDERGSALGGGGHEDTVAGAAQRGFRDEASGGRK